MGLSEDSFCCDSQAHSQAMGQEDCEKWTAAGHLQPAISKSDRLLVLRDLLQPSSAGRRAGQNTLPTRLPPQHERAANILVQIVPFAADFLATGAFDELACPSGGELDTVAGFVEVEFAFFDIA